MKRQGTVSVVQWTLACGFPQGNSSQCWRGCSLPFSRVFGSVQEGGGYTPAGCGELISSAAQEQFLDSRPVLHTLACSWQYDAACRVIKCWARAPTFVDRELECTLPHCQARVPPLVTKKITDNLGRGRKAFAADVYQGPSPPLLSKISHFIGNLKDFGGNFIWGI